MTTVQDNLDHLIDDVIRAIEQSAGSVSWPDERFFGLATRIARFQTGNHELELPSLASIPTTTTDTFRYSKVGPLPESTRRVVEFRTSGTTALHRGLHRLLRTDVYQTSALVCARQFLFERFPIQRLITLVPRWDEAPDSSLSFMLDCFHRTLFPGSTTFAIGDGRLDAAILGQALERAMSSRASVLLFSTTLAAAALLDTDLGAELPAGSVIITTGGAKGRHDSVRSESVANDLGQRLGAPCGSEYGMTELLSQAYQLGDEPFVLPPWCRVVAFDPESGRPLPHGESGLLRFIDLANVQSAVSVQTVDVGETVSPSSFRLHGRAAGAPMRGCSLTFEELQEDTR